jgi:alpha-beta hydrolase superfamily lysophospholipase
MAWMTVAVALWLVGSVLVAHTLTRRKHPMHPEPLPAVPWAQFTEHRITTADGEELGAWLDQTPGREGPIVLISHGNGGKRSVTLHVAELLAEGGYRSMLITHRAHGDSTGKYNDFGYSAQEDFVAAVQVIRAHDPEAPIIVWGRSLGAAAAVFAAPKVGQEIAGLILECPYKDLASAIRNRTQNALPAGLSHSAYLSLRVASLLILPHLHKISPHKGAASIPNDLPVLVFCGGRDRRARPHEAEAIHKALGDQSQFVLIPEGDHLQLHKADEATYRHHVLDFIRRCRAVATVHAPHGKH